MLLIHQVINFKETIHALIIFVKSPITAIDQSFIPYFDPPLKDKQKYWGDRWVYNLSIVRDQANKFALVTNIHIVPEQANIFVQ